MFLESKGAPMAAAKVGAAPPPTNGLVANAKEATDELCKARNYLNIKPAQRKDTLGYALDREEALGYLVTSALHLPLLSPEATGGVLVKEIARADAHRGPLQLSAQVGTDVHRWSCRQREPLSVSFYPEIL